MIARRAVFDKRLARICGRVRREGVLPPEVEEVQSSRLAPAEAVVKTGISSIFDGGVGGVGVQMVGERVGWGGAGGFSWVWGLGVRWTGV